MKTLELNQMEKIEAGRCNGQLEEMGFAVSGSGLIFAISAVAVAATPVGWGMLVLAAASMAISTASCMDER